MKRGQYISHFLYFQQDVICLIYIYRSPGWNYIHLHRLYFNRWVKLFINDAEASYGSLYHPQYKGYMVFRRLSSYDIKSIDYHLV